MAFGSFELICNRAYIPLCQLVGPYDGSTIFGQGIIARCFPRTIIIANTMIFSVGNLFLHLGGLVLIGIAIYNVYGKYTAVGRREMLDLFYLFFFLEVWSLITDAGVSPVVSASYPYFVAIQCGLSSAVVLQLLCTSLLFYQLWEDGNTASVWALRISSTIWGLVTFVIAILTFQGGKSGWPSLLNPTNTVALMIVLYVVNAVFMFFYAVFSFYLCAFTLKNWWAFGTYALSLFTFVSGQLLMYAFGFLICNSVRHYIDGAFFGTACNLFAFLMIYRAYDTITAEDLEFTVSLRDDPFADESEPEDLDEYSSFSNYKFVEPN